MDPPWSRRQSNDGDCPTPAVRNPQRIRLSWVESGRRCGINAPFGANEGLHIDGQGDAGGAAAWPRTPDEFRTRSSGSAYPLAPTAPGTPTIEAADARMGQPFHLGGSVHQQVGQALQPRGA